MLGFRSVPFLHNLTSKFNPLTAILPPQIPNSSSPLTPNSRKRFRIYAKNGKKRREDNNGVTTEKSSNGEEEKVKNELPRFNLRSADLLLDLKPNNIVAVGLTGLLTWASVQVLWQLFAISAAIFIAALNGLFQR